MRLRKCFLLNGAAEMFFFFFLQAVRYDVPDEGGSRTETKKRIFQLKKCHAEKKTQKLPTEIFLPQNPPM